MDRISIWVLLISLLLLLHRSSSEEDEVKRSLIAFFGKLSRNNGQTDPSWGWNMTSDPCTDKWEGVICEGNPQHLKTIVFDKLNLSGTLDVSSLCNVHSLTVLSLNNNNLTGGISEEIGNCKQLTHIYLSGNQFSGNLPVSLSRLDNLKRLDISNNNFSGELPDLPHISGLISFFAQFNQLSGEIPQFDFANLVQFNVSFNRFSGSIPNLEEAHNLDASSFSGNPELCGKPLPKECPPSPHRRSKRISTTDILMYSGYIILGLVLISFAALMLINRKRSKNGEAEAETIKKEAALDDSNKKSTPIPTPPSDYKTEVSRSEYSLTSAENITVSTSLIVLASPVMKGLRFEDLLKAPAELLGRGIHGSLYKAMLDDGMTVAVKRIKDWTISSEDFTKRMQKIDQAKHPNVLPVVAFYCSMQEKLIVYDYQQNGSLLGLLEGNQNDQLFDWGSRLSVASTIADALCFMHNEFRDDGIAHGNLKSSNILMNKNMEPCISEYGLMMKDSEERLFFNCNSFTAMDPSRDSAYNTFKMDVYGFGVILLELLTGKLVQDSESDLARWVHSVVREERTVEVFDRSLISEGANQERMVNLLQVALKCINSSPDSRPSINQVAAMINTLKEEEERSTVSEL